MRTALIGIGALVFLGCATSQETRDSQVQTTSEQAATQEDEAVEEEVAAKEPMAQQGMAKHSMHSMCPMMVTGTTVEGEDVEGGAALAFTTTGDVAELRRRVEGMAQMHSRHHSEMMEGQGMGKKGEGMQGKGMGTQDREAMMAMARSDARYENTEAGARLVFSPDDAGDLETLRTQVHHHAERMASGQCAMMMEGEPAPREGAPAGSPGAEESPHEGHHPETTGE